jgi:hypothetical protein
MVLRDLMVYLLGVGVGLVCVIPSPFEIQRVLCFGGKGYHSRGMSKNEEISDTSHAFMRVSDESIKKNYEEVKPIVIYSVVVGVIGWQKYLIHPSAGSRL